MINLYYHGGSDNHGCEAIVRTTAKLLPSKAVLWTRAPESDQKYGLSDLVQQRRDEQTALRPGWEHLCFAAHHKLTGTDLLYTRLTHKALFSSVQRGDIFLSIGGDNYCYAGKDILGHYNRLIRRRGGKTVLWGCSFEPADLDPETARDLAGYALITARESISFDVLRGVNPNTVLAADPAFLLSPAELPLPEGWREGNTVGINASPLILQSARDAGLALDAYRRLIREVLTGTDCAVALIPHVVTPGSDDRTVLQQLQEEFSGTGRVILIGDHNCMELKGYIARCRMFIGARTHATIAAYSSCVPTLVLGYSVKSSGIARDLFGTEEGYVLPVQSLADPNGLAQRFRWLAEREESIRAHLETVMPEYRQRAYAAREALKKLCQQEQERKR